MASFISRRKRINCVRRSLPPAGRLRPLAHVLRFAVNVQDKRLEAQDATVERRQRG